MPRPASNNHRRGNIDVSAVLEEVMDLASKHHIKLPSSMTMLARSVLAVEGVIEQLCPQLNLMEIISSKLVDRAKKSFDVKKTLLDAGKGILGVGKKIADIPGAFADALSGLAKGRLKVNFELTGLEKPLADIAAFVKNVMLAIISCVLFIGGCILCSVDLKPMTALGIPLEALAILVFSIALGIYAVGKMTIKKK